MTAFILATNLVLRSKQIDLIRMWTDDHIRCAAVKLDEVEVELMWCGDEAVGSAKYANESISARNDLIPHIKEQILSTCQSIVDGCDESGNKDLITYCKIDMDVAAKLLKTNSAT